MANTVNDAGSHMSARRFVEPDWRYEDRYSVSIVRDGVGAFRRRDKDGWIGPWVVVR